MDARKQKTHELKTAWLWFRDVWDGRKTFEIRLNDRDFRIGDILILKEYFSEQDKISERSVQCEITYILRPPSMAEMFIGLHPRYVILGISNLKRFPALVDMSQWMYLE